MPTLEDRLKAHAFSLGFDLVGIARATDADGFDRFTEWLGRGYAGEMAYLAKHAEQRRHPRGVLGPVKSVVMAAVDYAPADDSSGPAQRRQVRARRRLPPPPLAASRSVARLGARTSAGVPRPGRRRLGPAPRTRLRPPGRPRVVRQERHAHQQAPRQFLRPRRAPPRHRSDPRRAPRRVPLRHLYGLPRRLPHRCVRRPRMARRPPLHQLSHHRTQRAGAARSAGRRRRLALRLRRVSGRVPLEPPVGAVRRPLRATCRT